MEGHREIYRAAFETANVELTEIDAEFEKLSVRKEQVEKVLAALKTFFGEEQNVAVVSKGEASETATTATSNESSGRLQPVPSDPFQRRIDHVLGIGAGIRDVRNYTRQF